MNFLKVKKFWPIFVISLAVVIFFKSFIFGGLLPIPADTIIGLYHPFRDLYAKDYPRGIPFKNFLITDPVRQQYPWRELAIETVKKSQLPLWNPYLMTGYPLLGNQQSAPFYPLNILFFVLPFPTAWSLLIVFEPLLAGVFLYFYLNNLGIRKEASLLGSISFAFSGFSIAWLEWGTILHSALWLPLILLSTDKILATFKDNSKFKIENLKWAIVFIFALSSSLLAGHLQTFFYILILSLVYLLVRWRQHGLKAKYSLLFVIYYLLFAIATAIQWIPTLQLISESARDVDLNWQQEGWFIPWQHLIQFLIPDFFGNPTTLNYWGVWNYGEFVGYIGIAPFILALFALFFRRTKETFFFGIVLLISFLFSLPTGISSLPFQLQIPFLATAQPTRLLFLIDFSLAVLAGIGFDFFLKQERKKRIFYPLAFVALILGIIVAVSLWFTKSISPENIAVVKSNLRLPLITFFAVSIIFFLLTFKKAKRIQAIAVIVLLIVIFADLMRFGLKFTPFSNKEYLFPPTQSLQFLQKQKGQFRIMATDDRILPPNFAMIYKIATIDGYDPLYLKRFGELIAASERGKPDISPPFGFHRIITPENYNSKIIDLLGVRYVLSLSELTSAKLTKVFEEGQTRIYENKNALPRVFFVEQTVRVNGKEDAMQKLFIADFLKTAIVEDVMAGSFASGKAEITEYLDNKITIKTQNSAEGFLVMTDSYYPTWRVMIDGISAKIYRTDYNFRGIIIPQGEHTVVFINSLL